MADLIIPDPECISVDLQPGDEFLILASDGLWDVLSKPEAVRRVRYACALLRCCEVHVSADP